MSAINAFHVPWHTHALSAVVSWLPGLWKRIGNWETAMLEEELRPITVDRPVYVAGLARSGSTILLEAIAAQRGVVTHQYRDFPGLFTPYWWHGGQARKQHTDAPTERAHGDGLLVTPESPEAMEEMLWMAFFPAIHNPGVSNVLDAEVQNPGFEIFYREHIRKLLLAREGNRYASKENYNITRLAYLQKLFPDAKFVIPVRHPVQHIASLMKQHKLFCEGETQYARALAHMQRVGHFEFGLDLRWINVGNTSIISEIETLWKQGEEVRGWARYWAMIYHFLADQLAARPQLQHAAKVVRYEQLCDSPQETLTAILDHCELDDTTARDAFAEKISAPTYYKPKFTDEEITVILEETTAVAERFGYVLQPA